MVSGDGGSQEILTEFTEGQECTVGGEEGSTHGCIAILMPSTEFLSQKPKEFLIQEIGAKETRLGGTNFCFTQNTEPKVLPGLVIRCLNSIVSGELHLLNLCQNLVICITEKKTTFLCNIQDIISYETVDI